ncbi:MAG: glycosyltransferase family 2 protein [Acidobacteriota bacterium]
MPAPTRVSVIVPTLNSAEFLSETLDSLVGQREAQLEVLVVDGGSTDGTLEIVRAAETRLLLRWISEPDRGQADAINKGFTMASGQIVSWLNADDCLTSGALARVVDLFAREPDLDVLSGLGILAGPTGNFIKIIPETPIQVIGDLYRFGCHICQPSTFLHRRVIERHGPLDASYHYALDFEYWLRIGRSVRYMFVPEILSSFRLHPGSKTVAAQRRFWAEEWRAFRRHGGSRRSPFVLAHLYHSRVRWAAYLGLAPARWLLWPLFGLSRGEWLTPGLPPVLTRQASTGAPLQSASD